MRLTGRWVLWALTSGVALVWWFLTMYASSEVDSAVKHESTQIGTISRIDDSGGYISVDGREYSLNDSPPVWDWVQLVDFYKDETSYRIGQQVEVALDPDPDPDYNWAYDVSRYNGFSWWRAIAGLAFMLGLAGLARQWLTRNTLLTDGARWQLWRVRHTRTVTVVEVRERRPPRVVRYVETVLSWFSDHTHEHHHLVLEANGRVFFWEAKSEDDITIEPGMTFEVFGRLKRRGWIVALTEPPLYPVARLD